MNNAEMLEFYMMLKKARNADLKRDLRSIGRIKEENLDLAVSLLRKITTKEGQFEIVSKLASDDLRPNGCPGAVDPAFFLLQPATISELTYLMANNIKGTDLYTLWNDCSRRDTKRFILNIWALQSGVYTQSEIDENFRINRLEFSGYDGTDLKNEEQRRWFDRVQRSVVFPFIYDESVINPSDYMKDLLKADPNGEDFKAYAKANRAYQRLSHYLSQSELHTKGIKATDKNEITVSMVLPTYEHKRWTGWEWTQDNGNAPETFAIDTNRLLEILVDRPTSKHYDMMNRFDMQAAIHYLRHSKKQFLPGLSLMRTLPLTEVEDFYSNNNHRRFGELMKLGQYKGYDEQQGFIKLAYVLGLFSKSETDSQIASDYLKQHIIGKVDEQDLHKLYGTFDLKHGFNKDFAEFFMIHHSQNPHCFETIEGVDKTDQIYANFDKVLEFRPEKEIKTTTNRKRLTPEDALNALTDVCLMLGIPPELSRYASFIGKYTSNKDEIMWCIDKLQKGEQIPEEEIKIPYVEDTSSASCKFRVLKKGDPEIAITGIKTNCCFRYDGASSSSLSHAMTSPNSSVVVFESEKGYTQGWIWYDEENGVLVIDNLEGIPEVNANGKDAVSDGLMQAVLRYADQTLIALNKKGLHCSSVNLGTRYLNYCIEKSIDKYKELGLIKVADKSPTDYAKDRNLYTDAQEQYVLTDRELIKKHSTNSSTQRVEHTNQQSVEQGPEEFGHSL